LGSAITEISASLKTVIAIIILTRNEQKYTKMVEALTKLINIRMKRDSGQHLKTPERFMKTFAPTTIIVSWIVITIYGVMPVLQQLYQFMVGTATANVYFFPFSTK
jgi:hypothetical protein